jgi:exopolysaccharide production protein ExoZ
VLGCVALDAAARMPDLPRLSAIGDASYSLYLTHGDLALALGRLRRFLPPGSLESFAFAVAATALCVAFAALVYRYVEAPTLAALRRAARPGWTGVAAARGVSEAAAPYSAAPPWAAARWPAARSFAIHAAWSRARKV